MTVASQIKQTLAALKGAEALIDQYANYHPDPNAKNDFMTCKNQLEEIVQDLEQRVREIEFEEPQFKGF